MRVSSMPRRRGRRTAGVGRSAVTVVPALVMSGTYPNGAGCVPWVVRVSRPSAPARGGADVVDVPRRAPGPGAVREEVPERVALDVRAARLAEDRDALAAVGVPD